MKKFAIAMFLAVAILMPIAKSEEVKVEVPEKALIGEVVQINFTIENNENKNLTNLSLELLLNEREIYNKTIPIIKIGENFTKNLTLSNLTYGEYNVKLKVNGTVKLSKNFKIVREEEYNLILTKYSVLLNQECEIVVFIENNGNKTLKDLIVEVFDNNLKLDSFLATIKPGENFTKKISFNSSVEGIHIISLKVNGTLKAEEKLNVISVRPEQPKIDLSLLYGGLIILLVLLLAIVIKKFKLFKKNEK